MTTPTRLRTWIAAVCVAVVAATPLASASRSADDTTNASAAAASEPTVDARGLGNGRVFARARIDLPAPPQAVFEVVSDYDRLGDFVTAIDSSHVLRRDSTGVLVRQVGTTKLLIQKTVRMTLRFRPQPPERLWFEIVSGDFATYFGSWRFEPHDSGTRLTYDVTFTAPEHLPGPLVRHVVERDLRTMLTELRGEIARRSATSP